ncbi:hypothetical protein BT69DRAFT_616427 [Atractiella rhizophila]|nr:hypothetical protein BT69DRAFT_616427 [Atractiella rhizophila]
MILPTQGDVPLIELMATGSSRGTGDAEDIEVERAWRMGGGKGLPVYEGEDMKASTVLLSGPPVQPMSPISRRISTRITQGAEMIARLSRRISTGLGLAPPTPTSAVGGFEGLRPPPSPGAAPRSPNSSYPSTPSELRITRASSWT